MLKQINDTILVTGPFKINGVPLRRINPAYVIATSTKVELPSGLSLDKYDEAYFKVKKEKKGKSTEQEFFGEGEKVCFILEAMLISRRRQFPKDGHRIRKNSTRHSSKLSPKHRI